MELRKVRPIFLSIALIVGFVLLVMIVLTQMAQRYALLYTCGCAYNLPIIVILLSGTGIFIGALTYYFLSGNFENRQKKFNKNKNYLLNFLDNDEKEVVIILIKNKGSITQANLTKKLNKDRVKVFRVLEKLEQKNVILKEKVGKNNNIFLVEQLKEALL